MTKPTNEERREVAAKLRDAKKLWWPIDVPEQRCRSEVWQEFEKSIGASDAGTYNEVFAFVADLIEPEPERTCRMEYDPVHCDYVCTACGEWHNTGMYDACDADDRVLLRPYRFCPKCGARVEVER